jgi:dTDP-4-dehydrorhamnose reductase
MRHELVEGSLLPIATDQHPTPAKRPGNSRLRYDRLKTHWDFTFPYWQDSLQAVLQLLLSDHTHR